MPEYNDHHILIIDDQPHITYILKKFLEKTYNIIVASSIGEADKALQDKDLEISVAIIDFNLMDKIDGIEYATQLKKNHVLTQVVIISGASSYDIAIKALNSGVISGLINKPFAFDEIKSTVEEQFRIWEKNRRIIHDQIEAYSQLGKMDEIILKSTNLSLPHVKRYIIDKSKGQFDLLGFGVTKGEDVLLKYFIDKTIHAKYTPLFAKFIQTLSCLNLDLFVEADSHPLEELTMEGVSILFRSVNMINYSFFIEGEPSNKIEFANGVDQITSELSFHTKNLNSELSGEVKQRMINHFTDFKDFFKYQ